MTKRITTLLGILVAVAFAVACAQTDAGITTKVKSKLAADDTVKAYQIDVDTKDKVVTLSGNVDSQAAKDQAVALARSTEGVADVVDNITVAGGAAAMPGENPPMGGGAPAPGGEGDAAMGGNAPNPEPNRPVGQVMDDAAITAAVKAKLLADPQVGGLKIDVDTRNGVVYLTGDHMKSQAEIDQAIKLAKETSGVKDVVSKLVVGEKK
ncbi:MAG TPA: BON domain-containing protein [Thermoanaerobaculia bacterium]|jgi:hyperosmotically inducible protein|nr:BON domain-containing protein [Thermoanaerobaculia bacterium]